MPLVAPVIRICLSFTAQSYGHARNARINTCAGLVEYLFGTAHNAIAAMCPNTGAARVTRQPPPAGETASPWE
jgi:hypothetical protein